MWAEAIAIRISDEWVCSDEEDRDLLCAVLTRALKAVPTECKKLIGTTIIEEDYFESLD